MHDYNNTESIQCQVQRITGKMATKKAQNRKVIEWLHSIHQAEDAEKIEHCGEHIGITDIGGIAHIIKADFCRQRICSVCAWRRQSKFLAQMYPVLELLTQEGYSYIFVTLTMKNMALSELSTAIDNIMTAYHKLIRRRKITRAWSGICRSLELTYNPETDTFHPHLHLLVAVRPETFYDPMRYISKTELWEMWRDCLQVDYNPSVDIRATNDSDRAAVETIKYALKPTQADAAFSAFYSVLRGRRLISFSGVFAELRRRLKYSDIEDILTDDVPEEEKNRPIIYQLYQWDASGGFYRFAMSAELL